MRLAVAAAVACLSIIELTVADPAAAMAIKKNLNLPPQELRLALLSFSKVSGLHVVFISEDVDARRTPGVVGEFTPDEALRRLLKGTGLTFSYLDDKTVTIVPVASSSESPNPSTSGSAAGEHATQNGSFWNSVLLAQVDQGSSQGPAPVETQEKPESAKKRAELQEVVVTGSRIPVQLQDSPQTLQIYSRDVIDQTGVSTVTDFLNTLPSVSVGAPEHSTSTTAGTTTVSLHGLPVGQSLVLLNGRRLETSGLLSGFDTFDLNGVPLGAVDRIEVLSEGSSAVYGSDAIAGVVNIVLKKDLQGIYVDTKYSWAKDLPEWDTSLALGQKWDRGSFTLIGSFMNRGILTGMDRSLTASSDFTPYGGTDQRVPYCNPGNVYFPNGYTFNGKTVSYAAVPKGYTGPPSVQEFNETAGTLNKCSYYSNLPIIPASRREGVYLTATYDLTETTEAFTEILFSHTQIDTPTLGPFLYGVPGYQEYTVPATNPYNPFGQPVGVSYLFTQQLSTGFLGTTDFFRPLVGMRGALSSEWTWEAAAWNSRDTGIWNYVNGSVSPQLQAALDSSDPANALNVFGTGPPGSPQLLQSLFYDNITHATGEVTSISAFARGPVLHLPSGPIVLVAGGEYDRYILDSSETDTPSTSYHRNSYALFGEARVPIVGSNGAGQDYLSLDAAGRYDHYSDFGGHATPQIGITWRPIDELAVRANYSEAFKAPPIAFLHQIQTPQANQGPFVDPATGQNFFTTVIYGGNPDLKPETGHSHAFSLAYSPRGTPGVEVSVTQWDIDETNAIQSLPPQVIAENAAVFPQYITRDANGTITSINATYVNFGEFHVAGLDYRASYKVITPIGAFSTALNATNTYHFTVGLTPNLPAMEVVSIGQDTGWWAPRWKGNATFGWESGPVTTNLIARYVGKYQDYDSTTREIGNFWLFDLNARYALKTELGPLRGGFVDVGVRNLFDRQPQFSNYNYGVVGYDPTEADIVGRLYYVRLGLRF